MASFPAEVCAAAGNFLFPFCDASASHVQREKLILLLSTHAVFLSGNGPRMKSKVSDAQVEEYAARLRAWLPSGQVFPARMSDCEFTEHQRQVIREARAQRKAAQKNGNGATGNTETNKPAGAPPAPEVLPTKVEQTKTFSKLRKMLYLQSGRCFFCGELLNEEEASIEHLNPRSRGGTNTEDNQVVCHRTLNEVFGSMDLKTKFEFVLKNAGQLKCPKK